MRTGLLLALALLGAPAHLTAQAQADTIPAAASALPVGATRPATPAAVSTSGRAKLCDRLDVFDHYTGRGAVWGGVVGVVAGTVWSIRTSSESDAGLAAPMFFLVGPVMGGGYGAGAGALAGLGKWGWDAARGHAWRAGPRDRARREGLLCEGVAPVKQSALLVPVMPAARVIASLAPGLR